MRLVILRGSDGHALASPSGHVLLLSVIAEPARALRPVMTARTAEGRVIHHGGALTVEPASGFAQVEEFAAGPAAIPHAPAAIATLEA